MSTQQKIDLSDYFSRLESMSSINLTGTVTRATGHVVESLGPPASMGELIEVRSTQKRIPLEVVGFRDNRTISMPISDMSGLQSGDPVVSRNRFADIPVGRELLGRVIDSTGKPLDGRGPLRCRRARPLKSAPVNPLERREITEPLPTGVRAVDSCLTLGRGQRVGIFGGSGVGKSTLLAMIARHTTADVTVLAMVGERGREVRAFIENELADALERTVVVVATSEHSPLLRIRAALAATTIAEYFREDNQEVLLMMDSLTRFAMAQREVGLAAGEPPTARGYTPSAFSSLPPLVERAGPMSNAGSITAIYTVLVEGDDMADPIADTARSLLDGHFVLSRPLAERGHFPAIDLPRSLSRLMPSLVAPEHRKAATRLRSYLATLADSQDLIQLGAYKSGSSPELDRAISRRQAIDRFLSQDLDESSTMTESISQLIETVATGSETAATTNDDDESQTT